jgi:predicted dehydrogenase
VRRITADFGFRAEFDPGSRLFDPALGGGALLDIGIYPVSLAHILLGEPDTVGGKAHIGETGVDEESVVLLGYRGGEQAVLTMAIRLDTPRDAYILGTAGSIWMPEPWWKSERIVLRREGRGETTIDLPCSKSILAYQADDFMDLVRAGKTESLVMPLSQSHALARTMDRIRRHWGLRYPMEEK